MSKKLVAGLPLILSVALFAWPRPAGAADAVQPRIIVGNGTPESCTETALQDAVTTARLSGGGIIKFRCGANPVTIVLTVQSPIASGELAMLDVPTNTTIDGDDRITIATSFGVDFGIFVSPGATVALKNLALRIGGISYNSAFWNGGSLTLQGVSVSCLPSGSCIYNEGNLLIKNGAVSRTPGSSIYTFGLVNTSAANVAVKDTVFSDHRGVIFYNEGTATIDTSSFLRNTNDSGLGSMAAIYNAGKLTVTATQFSNNISGASSAIGNAGTLVLKTSTFSDNGASYIGGAISNWGQATIDSCAFVRNFVTASYGGGAVFNRGVLTVRNSDFSDNQVGVLSGPAYGGALYNGGTLTIDSSTFSGNAAAYGGAIANGGIASFAFTDNNPNGGQIRIRNSRITKNTASELGGGIYNYGTGTIQLDADTKVTGNTPDDIFP